MHCYFWVRVISTFSFVSSVHQLVWVSPKGQAQSIAMAFLEKLKSFGVSETEIKELFARHQGNKLPSLNELEIREHLPDPRKEVDNYASDIKSISIFMNRDSAGNEGGKKDANFMVKTSLGSFGEKVLARITVVLFVSYTLCHTHKVT